MVTLKSKSKDIFKSISDDYGNLIICRNNGKRVILSIRLITERKSRRVGVINVAQKTIAIKRDRNKHLLNINQSYGFNLKLLEDSKLFDKVRLSDQYSEFLIEKQWIIDNGDFLHFKKTGFEKQIFVTLSSIEQFKRSPKI